VAGRVHWDIVPPRTGPYSPLGRIVRPTCPLRRVTCRMPLSGASVIAATPCLPESAPTPTQGMCTMLDVPLEGLERVRFVSIDAPELEHVPSLAHPDHPSLG
jgi:hypothetical protein